MAYLQSETEEAIRVNGHHPMRAMFGNVRPVVCSFAETQIYNHGSRPNGSGVALSEVPRDGGTFGTRGDVRDDQYDHLLPCCQITAKAHYKIGRLDATEHLANKLKGEK